jgi:hypothetical protein
MQTGLLKKLIPAAVVSLVLVFSYLIPAAGSGPGPVKSSHHTNCGRFGYGYHGGKHNFVCPNQANDIIGGSSGTTGTTGTEGITVSNDSLPAQLPQTGQASLPTPSLPLALGFGLVSLAAAGAVLTIRRRRSP